MKRGETIATFNPSKLILRASDHTLDVISALYVRMAQEVFGMMIPADTFKATTKAFRLVQSLFYSPSGLKHNLIGRVETLLRPHSFFRAMSHRNQAITTSPFVNDEHARWVNPFTEAAADDSFWDLYERALAKAIALLPIVDSPVFDIETARVITEDLNFSGEATYARIVAIEDAR